MEATAASAGDHQHRPVKLPEDWRILWLAATDPDPSGALVLRRLSAGRAELSFSLALWEGRLDEPSRDGGLTIALPEIPTLDDAWTLYLLAARHQLPRIPRSWEPLCHYAQNARQGLWTDRIPVEHSIQAVYLVMAQRHLQHRMPAREAFLKETFRLFDVATRGLEEGRNFLDERLLTDDAVFERYVAVLAADRSSYDRDLKRSERFWATLPGEASSTGAERRLPMLVIDRPSATQFKVWARRDPTAPDGTGYPLLLVATTAPDHVVLTADPASRVTIGWLAPLLSRALGGDGSDWYAGDAHDGTLIASTAGVRLDLPKVIGALKKPLKLSPVRPRAVHTGLKRAGLAVLAFVASVVAFEARQLIHGRVESLEHGSPLPSASASSLRERAGQPLGQAELQPVFATVEGMTHFAVLVGVCRYPEAHRLDAPCGDARAVRDILIGAYGYRPENILLLVDDQNGPDVFARSDAQGIRRALRRMAERVKDGPSSTFLFYYSGHGAEALEAKEYGVLQPAGYFEAPDNPDALYKMKQLREDIADSIRAKHTMLILDCCYSGFVGERAGPERLTPEVMSLWNEYARVMLTAGTKDQKSYEAPEWGNHGALTGFLLRGLELEKGRPVADTTGDGIVTDDEMAAFLQRTVPEAVARARPGKRQDPQYFRLDDGQTKRGQFLFVPISSPRQRE